MPNTTAPKTDLLGLLPEELALFMRGLGQPCYRARQVFSWLHRGASFAQMTDLPKPVRDRMAELATAGTLSAADRATSPDGATRFALRTADGHIVESVLIPHPLASLRAGPGRITVCVSSQIGCAVGCSFCATGQQGLVRSLLPGEIVEQVVRAQQAIAPPRGSDCRVSARGTASSPPASSCPSGEWRTPPLHPGGEGQGCEDRTSDQRSGPGRSRRARPPDQRGSVTPPPRVSNVVFMGMGEPLANYEAVVRAVHLLNHPWGLHLGARHIAISTCGLPQQIRRLADEGLQVALAVSLHGATDEVRDQLVPVNRTHPIAEVLGAARAYAQVTGRKVAFQYVIVPGLNDTPAQAHHLGRLVRRMPAMVNLIPRNPIRPEERFDPHPAYAFAARLRELGVEVAVRRSRGAEVLGACGQLRDRLRSQEE